MLLEESKQIRHTGLEYVFHSAVAVPIPVSTTVSSSDSVVPSQGQTSGGFVTTKHGSGILATRSAPAEITTRKTYRLHRI